MPIVEALLFAAADPLPARTIVEIVEGSTRAEVDAALAAIAEGCCGRGLRLLEVAGGWQFRTAPEYHKMVKKLFKERPYRLTRAATETVAIVAYRQPVTKAEVESIRGVDCSGVLESLVERRLLRIAGRRDAPGRPLIYATTREFLEMFGLKDLRALPTLAELGDDMAAMAASSGFDATGGPEAGEVVEGDEGREGDGETQGSAQAEAAGGEAEGEASREEPFQGLVEEDGEYEGRG
jgi:segregation and condensation protein B